MRVFWYWILLIIGALVTVPEALPVQEWMDQVGDDFFFSSLVKCSFWVDHRFTHVRA